MKRCIFLFTLFFLFATRIEVQARHIVGGEMNYKYLGNNLYEITLTIYRDCSIGPTPSFDDPAKIATLDNHGFLIDVIDASIISTGFVANSINSPCLTPPANICYEVAQYIFTTNIPANAGDVTVVYQRCCRNNSILNLANVQGTGATYFALIPDRSIIPINSNPVFNAWPPTFICKDAPFTFDHSATDADGDSLVYELSSPYIGGDMNNPIPNPPDPPPYTNVTFLPPYSISNMLGGIPLTINSSSGELKAVPNSEGQYVYGVSVKEYRNGVFLGETIRDFQVNVISCPDITVASISQTIACGTHDANFVNNSFNAASYQWDFGDLSTLSDTSSIKNPVYTYPDTGDYWARLIAISPMNSLCNDTSIGIVHVYPDFVSDFYITNKHCSNIFSFHDQSNGVNGLANFWLWDFGDQNNSSVKNPSNAYDTPGEFTVRLISSVDSGCVDTLDKKVYVQQNPVSNFSLLIDTCTYTVHTRDSATYATGYRWSFGDSYILYQSDGEHQYRNPGDYDVELIVSTDSACIDTSTLRINIPPLPISDFDFDVALCDSDVYFQNLSKFATTYFWNFGDGDTSQSVTPMHTYSLSGYVPVQLIAESEFGCQDSLDKDIYFITRKIAYFEPSVDSCKGLVEFTNVTKNAGIYLWDFGDGSFSNEVNPLHHFEKDGWQNITLTLNSETDCSDAISKGLNFESPLGEKLFIPNTFTPNGDGRNDLFEMSNFRPCDMYKLTIFNRWGQKILESEDASNIIWDGTFKGEKLPDDVYVYLIENSGNRRQGIITILK